MTFIQGMRAKFQTSNKFYKALSIVLLLVIIGLIGFFAVSYLTTPSYTILNPQPVNDKTESFPTNHHAHIDHNSTTGVIVDIFGDDLPNDAWLTVVTEKWGTDVPSDAGAPLNIQGAVIPAYYDVKVTANVTFTSNVIAQVTIANQNLNQNCIMYYFNSTLNEWVSVTTDFQLQHNIIGTFPAIALTGTPLGIGDLGPSASPSQTPSISPTPTSSPSPSSTPSASSSPTPSASPSPTSTLTPAATPLPTTTPNPPPFVVPEYTVGALLALIACIAAFLTIKTRKLR